MTGKNFSQICFISESVTETGGVFEDLDAIRELKNAVSNPDNYFTSAKNDIVLGMAKTPKKQAVSGEESVQRTALSHEHPDVLSEAQNS